MEFKASLKNIPVSTKKVEPVLDIIRGKNALRAIDELTLINRKASLYIKKLVKSALANVESNYKVEPKLLVIDKIWVTKGPTKVMRRYRYGGRGRVKPYRKHRSNLYIVLRYGA